MSGSSVAAYTGMGWVGYWGKTTTRLKGLLAEPTGLAMDTQGNPLLLRTPATIQFAKSTHPAISRP